METQGVQPIYLENGATVHMVVLFPQSRGMNPHGLVLAEDHRNWVTWGVAKAPHEELWNCESGHYFQKSMGFNNGADPRKMAEFDFGLRLRWFFTNDTMRGLTKHE